MNRSAVSRSRGEINCTHQEQEGMNEREGYSLSLSLSLSFSLSIYTYGNMEYGLLNGQAGSSAIIVP